MTAIDGMAGANRGIGLSLAKQYVQHGWQVYGTYRDQSKDETKEVIEALFLLWVQTSISNVW